MTRVLVVEDDSQTAEEIRAALADHSFAVECAGNGRDGLLKAAAETYDAIVLDRMLPGGLDGLGVLATLRAAGVESSVLILSALSGVDEGSGANRLADKAGRYGRPTLSALWRSQHRVPDGRRTSIFEEQPVEIELSLVDPSEQLNAGNRDRRGPKPLEPEHRIDA